MVRGYLGAHTRGIYWGANVNPLKFYYGRKDDPPINHDLCWKGIVDDEKSLMVEYSQRPRVTEHNVAARKHDVFLCCDEEDSHVTSRLHAILRRMGYITYSTVGQMKVKVAQNGTADVRPQHVQVQKKLELKGHREREVAENAVRSSAAVLIVCKDKCPLTSEILAHEVQMAEKYKKPMMMLALSHGKFLAIKSASYAMELESLMVNPSFFSLDRVVDMSKVGEHDNESSAELATKIFTQLLEKEMRVVPGGLFRGAFCGLGTPHRSTTLKEDQMRFFGDEIRTVRPPTGDFHYSPERTPSMEEADRLVVESRPQTGTRYSVRSPTGETLGDKNKSVRAEDLLRLMSVMSEGEKDRFLAKAAQERRRGGELQS